MNRELQNKLFEKYPNQFKNLKYIECGDGWYEIVSRCCEVIQNYIDYSAKNGKVIDFYWSQIKEKFGFLRAYNYGADDYVRGVVTMAETMSGCVCEYSGNKGKLRNRKIKDDEVVLAWMKVLSDEEAKIEGYLVE
ncbi:hypothetical protein EB118_07910 [bacterium]|nr:hypothetical protein [bacterium]NDG30003.1 hypothetical protein [bacterium]